MEDVRKSAEKLRSELELAADRLKLVEKSKELEEIRALMAKDDFWSDSGKAQQLTKREAEISRSVQPWLDLRRSSDELLELVKISDDNMRPELEQQLTALQSQLAGLSSQLRFSGPYDEREVVLSIFAGAGGTDAQDWAQMLQRMYIRWAESKKCKVEALDESPGEEAGIKSATIKISGGDFLYGRLSGEHGVHRLVRLSPFNSDNLRQTSFAKVDVLPLIERPDELQLDEKDLKIDVFRAGGHGGQSVNTTDSAVRVTHLPTGISVVIQNERSQLQNKETALSILRSRLIQLQIEQHAKNLAEIKGPNEHASWGNQIRNYVLHPYKQVKDLRSGFESSDPDKVLNGEIDAFIEAWLSSRKLA